MKKGLTRIIFEFLSIVVAVVLAMTLSEARQDYLNKQQAERSYTSILEEIALNYQNLEPDSTAMAEMIQTIQSWLDADDEVRDSTGSLNYELSLLNKSAWDVAKLNTYLTYIDNDRLQAVSQVYEFQNFYTLSGNQVFDAFNDLMKTEENTGAYERSMRALQVKVALNYNALVGYRRTAREVLPERPVSE